MKKLYNVIFPIWLILMVPPIVLLVIPSNFIIDSIVLIIGFKILKLTNWFEKYKKSILKVWIFGFIVDIFGSILLLATQFLGFSDYLYNNLLQPVAWNPFSKPLGLIYVLVVVLICGILIYFINYLFAFNKTDLDKKQKRIISILLGIITAPYLFMLPTSYFYNTGQNLEKHSGVYIGDNSEVGSIISDIYSGKYMENFELDTKEEPYGVIINYKNNMNNHNYQDLEKDTLILFKLIDNISYVEFKINSKSYYFDKEYVSNIYEDIKRQTLRDIDSRYDSKYFKQFTYLGRINEYDLFDTSTTCGMEKKEIYSDGEYSYLVECSDIKLLYLVSDDKKIKVITALDKDIIKVDDLFKTGLKITKELK
ncbi:MAG: DUF4825 domain-containing protein [Firmicutes bacterium]|nr:DUF4825 domain-containing protein [Bacillota bacterium]